MGDEAHLIPVHIGLSRDDLGDPNIRKHHSDDQPQQDIGHIFQQMMAITDESLDEAQAR